MKNLRNIKYIVVYCTATPTTTTIDSLKKYWKEVRNWGDTPGYHYLIARNGNLIKLLDESKISNGIYLQNSSCINLAYIGGIDKEGKPADNRSDSQKHAMFDLIVRLTEKYPQATVIGHRDLPDVLNACPCFDVKQWLSEYEPDLGNAA